MRLCHLLEQDEKSIQPGNNILRFMSVEIE
jgi:hypothetical protein